MQELARLNRDCGAPDAELVAVGLLIALGEHNAKDRQRLLRAGRWMVAPELEREWHLELARVVAAGWPGDPVVLSTAIRAFREKYGGSGRLEQEPAFLILLAGFPNDERAAAAIIKQLEDDHIAVYFSLNRRANVLAELASKWQGGNLLTAEVERWLAAKRTLRGFGNLELYHFAKTNSMKAELLKSLRDDKTFWGLELHALMNVWGPNDPEVLEACKQYVNRAPEGYLQAQEHLPVLAHDPLAARRDLLDKIRPDTGIELSQVLLGLRALDSSLASPDIVDRCFDLRGCDVSLWDNFVEGNLLAHGSPNPRVRALALEVLGRREWDLGAVAEGWGADPTFRAKMLAHAATLPTRLRYLIVESLERLPGTEAWADEALAKYDLDDDMGVRCTGAISLVQRGLHHGTLDAKVMATFSEHLDAVGPNQPEHSMAGLAGLLAAEQYDRILPFLEKENRPLNITTDLWLTSRVQPIAKLLMQRWEHLSQALSDVHLNRLLQIVDPHHQLLLQHGEAVAGSSFAKWFFEQGQGSSDRWSLEDLAAAYPGSPKLKQACLKLLHDEVPQEPSPNWWPTERAARLLARHFGNDDAVREELTRGQKLHDCGENTLLALARGWPSCAELAEWVDGLRGGKVHLRWSTVWAVRFALTPAETLTRCLQTLDVSMNRDSATAFRDQSVILVSQLARYPRLVRAFADEVMATTSTAVLITWLVSLGSNGTKYDAFHTWLQQRAESLAGGVGLPMRFGIDYTTGLIRSESRAIAVALSGR